MNVIRLWGWTAVALMLLVTACGQPLEQRYRERFSAFQVDVNEGTPILDLFLSVESLTGVEFIVQDELAALAVESEVTLPALRGLTLDDLLETIRVYTIPDLGYRYDYIENERILLSLQF